MPYSIQIRSMLTLDDVSFEDPERGYNFIVTKVVGKDWTDTAYHPPYRREQPSKLPQYVLAALKGFDEIVPKYDEERMRKMFYGEDTRIGGGNQRGGVVSSPRSQDQRQQRREPEPEPEPEEYTEPEPEEVPGQDVLDAQQEDQEASEEPPIDDSEIPPDEPGVDDSEIPPDDEPQPEPEPDAQPSEEEEDEYAPDLPEDTEPLPPPPPPAPRKPASGTKPPAAPPKAAVAPAKATGKAPTGQPPRQAPPPATGKPATKRK
jgi:hypothetical protein